MLEKSCIPMEKEPGFHAYMGTQGVIVRCLCLAEIAGMMVHPVLCASHRHKRWAGGHGECYVDRWQLLVMAANLAMRTQSKKRGEIHDQK